MVKPAWAPGGKNFDSAGRAAYTVSIMIQHALAVVSILLATLFSIDNAPRPAGDSAITPLEQVEASKPADAPVDLVRWVTVSTTLQASQSEVTVKAYRLCVEAGACTAPDDGGYCNWGRSDRDQHPINCVDWFQARAFAEWADARLPTETEWLELSDGRLFPWGNQVATCSRAAMMERSEGCAGPGTSPVCSHPLGHSQKGLCDLAGNVWEWVDNGAEPLANGAPEVLREQLAMGGAYYSLSDQVGRRGRLFRLPEDRGTGGLGFRLVRNP